MKKFFEAIPTVVGTILLTFLINTGLAYLTADNGLFQLGDTIKIEERLFRAVTIANYRYSPMDGLILSLPMSVEPNKVISSQPLDIAAVSSVTGASHFKHVKLSGVPPKRVTQLLVPINNVSEADFITPINAAQLNLATETSYITKTRLGEAVSRALTSAIIYGLMLLVFVMYMEKRTGVLRVRMEKLQSLTDKHEAQLKGAQKRTDRIRIYLLARISDYTKELQFWRDSVRKILYQHNSKEDSNKIIQAVTESLKTYSTRTNTSAEHFRTIETMAKLLAEGEADKK